MGSLSFLTGRYSWLYMRDKRPIYILRIKSAEFLGHTDFILCHYHSDLTKSAFSASKPAILRVKLNSVKAHPPAAQPAMEPLYQLPVNP